MINRRGFVRSLGTSTFLAAWAKAKDWLAATGPSAQSRGPVQAGGVSAERPYSIESIPSLQAGRATFELCEFRVPVRGKGLEGLNPFRATELALDAEFTLPSGKTMRVPGFYSEDYILRDHKGVPVEGSEGWRVRFSGPEAGAYRFKVELRVKGELAATQEGPAFTLRRSRSHGMIRVSRLAPRYLEYDDGASFFAVGQDVAWTTDVTKAIPGAVIASPTLAWDEAFSRWFSQMGQNGANWARVFMKPNFYLESGEPWAWSLENAWRLDQVLELARQNGIYFCLCFNPERSDSGTCYKGAMDLFRASNTAWGRLLSGHQSGFEHFFTDPLCREMYRDKIRYVVGRWGYSSNVFSWELWNEIGTVSSTDGVGRWCREMTAYLRATDPWHHLIEASTSHLWLPEHWGKDNGDLNDVHPYFGWSGVEEPKNLGSFLPESSSGVYATGRPFIIGETGIAREVTTKYGLAGDLADKDVTCFHVHEALWGGLFSGAVGTGMVWWWDEDVDRHQCYYRFHAISNFIADIEFNKEGFTRGETACTSSDQLRLFELVGKRTRLLWIRHRDLSWYGLGVEGKKLQPVEHATLTLTAVQAGQYHVEFWNTEQGKLLRTEELVVTGTSLDVPLRDLESEMALKVRWVK
jgi:hypothetical protein